MKLKYRESKKSVFFCCCWFVTLRKLKFEIGVKLKEAKKEREKKKNLKFEIVQRLICLCMKKTDRNVTEISQHQNSAFSFFQPS
jgi:hypothetical protein